MAATGLVETRSGKLAKNQTGGGSRQFREREREREREGVVEKTRGLFTSSPRPRNYY